MKKISTERRLMIQRIGRRRTEIGNERRSIFLRRKRAGTRGVTTRAAFDNRAQREAIRVAEVLDLGDHRHETLSVARACRENCFIRRRRTVLDFSATKKISSAAVLLLVAELDRCRRFAGEGMLTGTYPKDPKLHQQMHDSGFFEALHVKSRLDGEAKTYPLEYIKVMSGNQADGHLARELRLKLLGPLDAQLPAEAKSSFFRSLSEAMTNVAQHAYPESMERAKIRVVPKGWWMLGHINRLRQELKVMIVDQGIGIPRSLPKKYSLERIRAALSMLPMVKPTDAQMIFAAMDVGRSRMSQDHRGKGLNDLKKLIQVCGHGRLRILSNNGEYIYSESVKERLKNYDDTIHGTFIEWTVPLRAILPVLQDERNESDQHCA